MDKVNQLLSLQDDRFEQIGKAQRNYAKAPKARIVLSYLDTRLENLEKLWQAFKASHEQLVAHVSKEQRPASQYFTEDVYDQCEEIYINYKSELKQKIHENTLKTEQVSSNKGTDIKLPTITIPVFSGKYTEWPSFHDLFSSLIHNNEALDTVQKLHYLKSTLSGEAEQLLRSIPITSKNYEQAWSILNSRYNNKRFISNCIFKKLFGLKVVTESSIQIKNLLDTTIESLNALKNLNLPIDTWDAIIIYMTVSKLDSETHRLWEQQIATEKEDYLKFEKLKQFLEMRFRSLEMIEYGSRLNKTKSFHSTYEASSSAPTCVVCNEDHYIYQCKKFGQMEYKEKLMFAQNHNLCYNCLIPNHSAFKCMRDTSCRICKKKHHSLLHPEKKEGLAEDCHKDSEENILSHFVHQPNQILLATALVDVASSHAPTHTYRALIDQGSQASFVTEDLVQTQRLKRVKINGFVSGLSEGNKLHTKYMVEVQVKSRYNTNFTITVRAYVLKSITNYLPTEAFTVSNWPELKKMQLADPGYNIPNRIHLLLGADVYSTIIETGLLKSPSGITAQCTHLGWILSGDTKQRKEKQTICMHICVCDNDLLRKFWEIENETFSSKRKLTKEEELCEQIFKDTVTRTETGRYKVHLPFKIEVKSPVEKCGNTKEIAKARFLQLERKLEKNNILKEEYKRVMHEYIQLNHMIPASDTIKDAIYLPHHAVIRDDKDTTKVRVVFDASAKGSKGSSLNDTLLIGPIVQGDLRSLIMLWRRHRISVTSDIIKMYRQILVADNHLDYQRILWRDDPNEELHSYKLCTVTFGTACAPYLAVRTLLKLAEDEGHKYPIAAKILKNSFYMDDLMTGADSFEQALEIYKQMNELLHSGGFTLQKWSSNSEDFLNRIKQSKETLETFEIKFDKVIKILGLSWDRIDDKLKFFVEIPDLIDITKRTVLSEIARLFDPFGWLAPTIIKAKILIQKLWLCSIGWDEPLPEILKIEWIEFRQQLQELQKIHIDRWLHTHSKQDRVELHGFADASTSAYAAVVYMKVIYKDQINISILQCKTKVAPLKQISVARLELCAAVLLSKILDEATLIFNIPKDNVFAYTDSMVVLAWIQSSPVRWQTFVANRVTEIQNRIDNDRWSHVCTADNPADLASRGVEATNLARQDIWWKGPTWLTDKERAIRTHLVPDTSEEENKKYVNVFFTDIQKKPIWENFSSLHKMIRVLTYCRRFLRLKVKLENRTEQMQYLTNKEMRETLDNCIKIIQAQEFGEEIEDLKTKNKVKKRSKLVSLLPYLDTEGLLRVGGRLQAAELSNERKHPVIIPNKSYLTTLIVRDAHYKLLHGSMSLTMNYLRSHYWIIGLKALVRKCFRTCVVCIRHRAMIRQPTMGNLPSVRVNPGRPFEVSGVDFAGPIQMRLSKGRGQKSYKGYICLFICMKTRAIHLEAVSDLTSQGFIAAYRRFVSRRGHCYQLWSDNGLNFVGAARELKIMFDQSKSNVMTEVAELLANDSTTWHFIPPRAPNFGGLWEAGIKSVKTHLTKTIGNSTLTFEEMTTLLSQIEACLNSRPLYQLDNDPEDLNSLTPSHFLVGEPLITIPDRYQESEYISPLNRWRLLQRMMKQFWDRWSKEFLHTMQQRNKWQSQVKEPMIGEVVIIKDSDLPPAKWLLARITHIYRGSDDQVRVVTLRTKNCLLKRPLSKLVFLPHNEQSVDKIQPYEEE